MYARRASSILTACFALPMLVVACGSESKPVAISTTTSAVAGTAVEKISSPTTSGATSTEAPSKSLHGKALAAQVCLDSLEYFEGLREMAEQFGDPYDPDEAAKGLIELAQSGGEEFLNDLEQAGMDVEPTDPNEPTWAELSAADRAQIEGGIRAAATGEC
ncbi:hypothetical protein [Rhodococcus erythropolis]|uniref:hypothetical protein n=1 Tax=Rhodococcus erythropolis TaxID=1833 RepID=UPI0008B5022B|nr:hypothetical protein [Rhodococcus erythropolis]OFV77040.1 hypothetical protein RERY_22030 [Rhodococcus erythropolis]